MLILRIAVVFIALVYGSIPRPNESVADVFGSLVKQRHHEQTAHAAD